MCLSGSNIMRLLTLMLLQGKIFQLFKCRQIQICKNSTSEVNSFRYLFCLTEEMLRPKFRPTVNTHTKFRLLFSRPFSCLQVSCVVFLYCCQLSVFNRCWVRPPPAVAMPLYFLSLSLSFQSPHKVLFCNSVSAAKIDSFGCPPLCPRGADDRYKSPFSPAGRRYVPY